ncbi:MAG: histidine phosphatase family protein [Planctomycetes bacterium]|nr:histidine phosphatase family protein [Planctomycetota bacterium]
MKFYFVRHSETPCLEEGRFQGQSDRPGFNDLSESGRRTAERIADLLADIGIERIYCSPLRRTRETARVIGERKGLEPIPEGRLIEVNYGDWEGKLNKEVYDTPEAERRKRDKFRFRHPGGESYAELYKRVVIFLNELKNDEDQGPVLLVGHAGTIRSALIYFGAWTVDHAMSTKPDHDVVYEFDTETKELREHR